MDEWHRRIFLENIVYKMFRGIGLNENEKKMVEKLVEIRDYGDVLN